MGGESVRGRCWQWVVADARLGGRVVGGWGVRVGGWCAGEEAHVGGWLGGRECERAGAGLARTVGSGRGRRGRRHLH